MYDMITSSNGNIFRVTGHLCGEFIGPGEFRAQRSVARSFDVFSDLRLNTQLSKQWSGWWFETLLCPSWRHCNDVSAVSFSPGFQWRYMSVRYSQDFHCHQPPTRDLQDLWARHYCSAKLFYWRQCLLQLFVWQDRSWVYIAMILLQVQLSTLSSNPSVPRF